MNKTINFDGPTDFSLVSARAAVDNPQTVDERLIGAPLSPQTSGVFSSRPGLGRVMLSLTCFCLLFGGTLFAQQQAPQKKAAGGTLTIDLEQAKPWSGDLDGMIP
jgi:hypothetical protein